MRHEVLYLGAFQSQTRNVNSQEVTVPYIAVRKNSVHED